MSEIGLFYASSTGNTEDVANEIIALNKLGTIDLINVDGAEDDAMKPYTKMIIGVSTWGDGDLQDDWEDYLPHMSAVNFSNKVVAFYGLGDQEEYSENFLDGMGTLYDIVAENGGTIVGSWPLDGYECDSSTAIRDNEFVGLALDEDNQSELTTERIKKWVEQIAPYYE